jgi:hypothetical protein
MAYYIEGLSVDTKDRPHFSWVNEPVWDYPYTGGGRPVSLGPGPFVAVMTTKHKYPPDFICLPPAWGVTEEFRAMVEDLEPGVHQFFEAEVTRKNGVPLEHKYYLFNICQRIDAVIIDRSDVYWDTIESNIPGLPKYLSVLHISRGSPHFTLSRPAIAGRHIWRGNQMLRNDIFFSDALMQRVLAAKLRKLRFCYADEVDEPPTSLEPAPVA